MITYKTRVYYEDTDAVGVVYYANYLKWMERARTEWLHHLGLSLASLNQQACMLVVHHIDISYRSPARLEEQISLRCRLTEVGAGRVRMYQSVEREEQVLVEGYVTLALVDSETFKVKRFPKELRERLMREVI
ncbi:MAG: YbgC/FadM family acyl-CoA thioesterase [Pseudomonadota bacterium]